MFHLGKRKRNAPELLEASNDHTRGKPLVEDMDHSDQSSDTSDIFSPPIPPVASDISTNPTEPMALDIEDSDSDLSISSEEPSDISSDSESDPANEDTRLDASPSTLTDPRSDDPGIIKLRVGEKPTMRLRPTHTAPANDLLAKVRSFMPQMRAANEELEREKQDGTLDRRRIEVDDEDTAQDGLDKQEVDETERGPIIEMNLGLGVLEEQKHGIDGIALPEPNCSSSESGQSDSDSDMQSASRQVDVLSKLLGREHNDVRSSAITVVCEGEGSHLQFSGSAS